MKKSLATGCLRTEGNTITPKYKQKVDPLECGNYSKIKLLNHCQKLWELVKEFWLSVSVDIKKSNVNSKMQVNYRT